MPYFIGPLTLESAVVDTARWKYWKAWKTMSDARLKGNDRHTKHSVGHLQQSYSGLRGLSLLSLERFCSAKEVYKHPKVTREELDAAVSDVVSKVSYAMWGNAPIHVDVTWPAQ